MHSPEPLTESNHRNCFEFMGAETAIFWRLQGMRISSMDLGHHGAMTKKKKSRKELARETLVSVAKEMAQPRFAESAREEEDANHHATVHRHIA
jgi:hypothetical protein